MINKIIRYERKWILENGNLFNLINSLIRSNFFFRNQYENRKVNSIYFDSSNFISVRQNLDGISEKKKIRLRWYGEINRIINPVIEIKIKKGFETKKSSISINKLSGLCYPDFKNLDSIKKQINFKLETKKNIFPVASTHYEREYFISHDNKIRATIDYNLKSVYLNNFSQIDITKNFKNVCILEFKYPVNLDQYVRKNLNYLSLRLSRNSKYINSLFEKPKSFS